MQLLQQQQQQQQRSTGIVAKYRFHFIIFLLIPLVQTLIPTKLVQTV